MHGWRLLFSRQSMDELTSRYDHTPLSKLYSKSEAAKIFSDFKNVSFEVTTYGGAQVHPLLRYVWLALNSSRFLMDNFGSFLVIRGTK
jgi:hypothetical protein